MIYDATISHSVTLYFDAIRELLLTNMAGDTFFYLHRATLPSL